MTLRIFTDFNEAKLKEIAKDTGNKQIVADVAYCRTVVFFSHQKFYCEYCEEGFLVGYKLTKKQSFRIIGIGTRKRSQGKGLASFFLNRAIDYARKEGLKTIETRSLSGAEFYARRGFDVVGMRGGDYLLQLSLEGK